MTDQLTHDQVRRLRFRAQRLTPDAALPDVASLMRESFALQSQEPDSAALSIQARTNGVTHADVKCAREVERSLVLTWAMRGTMHLVPAADVRWLLAYLGPIVIRKTERRFKQLGLDEGVRARALNLIPSILSEHDPLNRADLADALAEHGVPVEGQAIHHLVRFAALSGVICFGPEIDGDLTYVVLDDWLSAVEPAPMDDTVVLPELARRYLNAYAPATLQDFVTWAGIPKADGKAAFAGISDACVTVEIGGDPALMLESQWDARGEVEAGAVRLLPRYDSYLLGYQDRGFMIDDAYARRVHPGGGLIKESMAVDGRLIGTWRLKKRKADAVIHVDLFEPLEQDSLAKLNSEAERLGQFLGQSVSINL